jgi:hypothetical protein
MKTNSLSAIRALFCCVLFANSLMVFADGGVGYKGLQINVNGTQTWYNVHGVSWSYQGCSNFGSTFYNSGSSNWSSTNLGTFSSNSTFQITGYAVVGWVTSGDYLAGRLEYKIWKNTESEPATWSLLNIGNYESPTSGASQVVCTSNNDRIIGYNNGTTNIMPSSVGTYNFKVRALGRVQYTGGGGGFFNANNGTEMTATFEVYDPYTIADGDWNTSSIWHNSTLPSSNIPVIINHNVTINSSVTNQAASVTINSGKSLTFGSNGNLTVTSVTNNGTIDMITGGVLNVASGGTLSNGTNTFISGAGTVNFVGSGLISGTIGFNNVNISGGVNFGSSSTINGILTINSGGFVNTNPPTYGSGSILKYNIGAAYGRSTEWNDNDGSGTGYPHHVQISSNTTLNFNNGSNIPGFMAGNLTIDSGSKLSMETLTTTSSNIGLTVTGNIVNSGTIEMNSTTERLKCTNFTSNPGSTTTLSTAVGGDLELTGNLTENGNINSSNRAIFFTGTGIQEIQGSGTFSVDYIVLNKASGSVKMLCDLLCEGPNGGNAMTLTNSTDILDLNSYALTIGQAGISSSLSGLGYLKASSSSSLSILGTGNFGTINFDPTSNIIGSLTLNRTSTNAGATLGENLTATSINITSGTLTLAANKQLTVSGTLTNNGIMTIESGATFKQGTSVAGTGTFNVKQIIDNGAGSGITLTGRYWYLGSPLTCTRSSAFGNAGDLNKVWSFANGAYAAVANTSNLTATKGYVHRRSDVNTTLTFSGTNLFKTDTTIALSNNAGTYGGWHLVSNPYTAYLDWHQVYNASNALSTAISPSYYIRSFNSTGNDLNALITYNSSTGLESNTSSYSLGSTGSNIAQYIAPMQAIWIKVNPTATLSATAGQLRLERAFTSHQTGNAGLKNTIVFPTLARVNLVDGARFDQVLVFMNQDMTNAVDQNDSEKMFVSGAPQIYTMAAGKKLVMNGLKNNKKKISVPLHLDLPTSKVYQLQLSEYIMEDGLIILEDKQEGTMQDFTINDTYSFFANNGVLSNRFVLHFFMPDATITVQGPSNSWVEDENEINEGGSILVNSNGKGKVTIQQDIAPLTADGSLVIIRDASGRMVYEGQLEGTQTSIQLEAPSGVYFVSVELNGQVEVKKIFVQQ